jgi:hypothetical protein
MKLTTHLHLVLRLTIREIKATFLKVAFMVCTGPSLFMLPFYILHMKEITELKLI